MIIDDQKGVSMLKYYVADAFADEVFEGNPAGVCILDEWLPIEKMEKIAIENNLSETAFAVKEGDVYGLRWFTPGGEIDLCGHATMGTAYILFRFVEKDAKKSSSTPKKPDTNWPWKKRATCMKWISRQWKSKNAKSKIT